MKYAILFEDNDELAHMRTQHMQAHLQFLSMNADKIIAAGPMKDAIAGTPAGGLWLVEASCRQEVQSLIETDPFWPTGLRSSIRILEWTQVFTRSDIKQ